MTVDAASAGCCCGGGVGGPLGCSEWLLCAPASINFVVARAVTTVRRYPAGGVYTDTIAFSAIGTMSRQFDGSFIGSLSCSSAYHFDREAAAGGAHYEEDGQQPCGNPWGCPNLDCCATRLSSTEDVVIEPWTMPMQLRCVDSTAGFGSSLQFRILDDGEPVMRTRTVLQILCVDPSVPNPLVESDQISKSTAWAIGGSEIGVSFDIASRCLPTDFFAPYNYDITRTETQEQAATLTCYRTIFVPPFFELVGTCYVTDENGVQVPGTCGDIVATVRDVRTVTLG